MNISNFNTQKLPEVIQGGEVNKPENSRARRRRESQLITARLLNHLPYVGPPERTRWLREPAGTKNLVRPPRRSCSAPGKEGA